MFPLPTTTSVQKWPSRLVFRSLSAANEAKGVFLGWSDPSNVKIPWDCY